ncbi:MAG: FAD-binding and (Fe-S)-binding domain-containing protein [Myxococcales bacterium]
MHMAASDGTDRESTLQERLEQILGKQSVLTGTAERIAHAHDGSFYRLVPQAVALARTEDEVARLFRLSHDVSLPLTFRAAGTSLSGQALSDGILVDISRGFSRISVENGGRRVRVEPGLIGAQVNRFLAPYRTKMGPDPASIATCRVGGILANNSSGMCCGVEQNAYHTLESLTFLLPSGTRIDTARPDADEELRAREPDLHAGLLELKRGIENDAPLAARIRAKYRMKNTTGYGLNAFLDFERPVDIFAHLLIGSEGTLAFISEVVLRTVPDLPHKLTGLLLFPDVHAACAAISPLRNAGARALELMDRASLRSVQGQPGMPAAFAGLGPDAAALLAELQCETAPEAGERLSAALAACERLSLLEKASFTRDAGEQAKLWRVRSGLFPSVGAVRKSGTTVIIEDVAFPLERLADASLDLTALFAKHGYREAIVFGHAKDGNLHFVITQAFGTQAEIDRYARFIDDLVQLVVSRHGGALKAEHGTGRNMAPFVEVEWGPEALAIMRRLKRLADPRGLLNPGVIVNDDPRAHLRDLKPMPAVEPEIDRCIECGFCEPRCPSRELTLTPRQRIVLWREMTRQRERGDLDPELEDAWGYLALDTCATDGLCATACPVGIDTGLFIKRQRKERHGETAQALASAAASHFAGVEMGLRASLHAGALFSGPLTQITRGARKIARALPLWSDDAPAAAKRPAVRTDAKTAQAIYFPSCISRTMGLLHEGLTVQDAFVRIADRAGVPLHVPADAAGTCCGVPFSSKGYTAAHAVAANHAVDNFWRWSENGRLPVVIDTSPCTYGILHSREALDPENADRFDKLRILDAVAFAHDSLLPALSVKRKAGSIAVHPVCSLVKMDLTSKLAGLARACSDSVLVPGEAGCCGFAGDRGFLVPELTASATAHEAAEIRAANPEACYSSSRTCEIGISRATGIETRSILFLLEEATRPA